MTQPRKEQINDQRSYFTRIDSYGVSTPIPFGTPDVPGGTVQTIQNNVPNPEAYYTEFLATTVTGTPGGAESDCPAFFFGNVGPFTTAALSGKTFTITLPNINGNAPVSITFQPSDVVNIGGTPYLTTSKVAARINTALTVAGVSPLSPVAANLNGQIVLTSAGPSGYTTGESAFITVNDVSSGVCSALGFSSGPTATANGISSPQRGIITTSGDGLGGYVQLQLTDGSPAVTQSPVQINIGGYGNLPLYPAGQNIYGRLQQFPGISNTPKFTVSYVRQGAVSAKIITSGETCSTLLSTDTFNITVSAVQPALMNPARGPDNQDSKVQNYTFTVSFSGAPTGPSDVISAVNTAWNAVAASHGLGTGTEAGRGGVVGFINGPWQFDTDPDGSAGFWILFNGQALNQSIKIAPTGPMTAVSLAAFINAAIAFAGQSAQGQASVGGSTIFANCIQITSALTTGANSSVQILAGDAFFSSPAVVTPNGTYQQTLNKLGISPGIYTGFALAAPYGNQSTPEEIQFTCPDHTLSDPFGTAAGIQITGSVPVMAKLGLSGTSVQVNTSIGFEPVSPPVVHALIPEMMYFGEVPENVETTVTRFLATDEPTPALPSAGTKNVGVSPLMGTDGKVNPDLIRKIFDVLSVGALTLGATTIFDANDNSTPRVVTPYQSNLSSGVTLLWQGISTAGITGAGSSQCVRLYLDNLGNLWVTTNAAVTNASTIYQWNRDEVSQSSSAISISQSTSGGVPKVALYYSPASANPFTFPGEPGSGNIPSVGFDPSGGIGGALAFLLAGTTSTVSAENLVPRLQTAGAPGDITLIWQSPSQSVSGTPVPGVRLYVTQQGQFPVAAGVIMWFTINAMWNGVDWIKDVNGVEAEAITLWQSSSGGSALLGNFSIYYQAAGTDTWPIWGVSGTGGLMVTTFNGFSNEVQAGSLVPGFNIPQTAAGRETARIFAGVDNGTTLQLRTLMTQWGVSGVAGGGGAQTRVYRGYGLTTFDSTGPGANDFTIITHNAGWDAVGLNWVQDVSTIGSSAQTWSNVGGSSPSTSSGQIAFYSVPEGSGTFADAIWACTGSFTRVGLQLPYTSDPNNSLSVPNLSAPPTITKAWGYFSYAYNSGSPSNPTLNLIDSWNVASITPYVFFGVTLPEINFHANMASFNYVVNVTAMIGYLGYPALYGAGSCVLAAYSTATAPPTIVDFSSSGIVTFSFSIVGRQ
jgi:hypothetical protein